MDPFQERTIEQVRATVDKTTAEFLKNLPTRVERLLAEAVYSILGLEKSFGEMRVKDSYPDKTRPLIQQYIQETTKRTLASSVDEIVLKAIIDVSSEERFKKALIKYASEHYRRKLEEELRSIMDKRAKADAEAYVARLGEIFLQPLINNTELNDPKSFPGETGEIILEGLVDTEIGPLMTAKPPEDDDECEEAIPVSAHRKTPCKVV